MGKDEPAIDGRTGLLGLIGNPVEHTLSPDIHNTLARLCGRNLVYVPFLVEPGGLGDAVRGAYALHVQGLNITVPYKQDVIPYLLETESLAAAVGSVNTLVRTQGGYRGYNTDMSGLFRAMKDDGIALKGKEVILLGAGGVGRAIAFMCAFQGAGRIWILNRDVEKAKAVAVEVNEKTGRECCSGAGLSQWRELPEQKYLAIQATSVGLFPDCGRAVIEDPDFYRKLYAGYDLIYRPAKTKFMSLCEAAGACAFNGLKMLVYQGVEAFELWNGLTVGQEQADHIYRMLSLKMEGFGQ